LWTREGQLAFVLGGYEAHFGIMADCPEVIDPYAGERRSMKAADIGRSALLADALPNLHFVCEAGWAPDYPVAIADRVCFKQILTHTAKPLGFCCTDARALREILEMASVVSGGASALRAKPFLFHYAEPTSPLVHTEEALGKLLVCAEERVPLVYTPMPISGASAPASFAGTIALNVAECLSGLVIAQLRQRGAPVIFGGIPGPLDMRTTIFPYGSPELQLMVSALADIAHYYRLPMFGTAGGSDSKTFDLQASLECLMSCMLATFSGANLIHNVGFLDHCSVTSYDMMVLADEVIGLAAHINRGIDINDKELALDLIDKVGPGGSFLDQADTLARCRSWCWPTVIDRSMTAEEGISTLADRVRRKVLEVLETHQCTPPPLEITKELERLESRWS
jgi:trimethylamine--corrinoid protein Co-methyltransferase